MKCFQCKKNYHTLCIDIKFDSKLHPNDLKQNCYICNDCKQNDDVNNTLDSTNGTFIELSDVNKNIGISHKVKKSMNVLRLKV